MTDPNQIKSQLAQLQAEVSNATAAGYGAGGQFAGQQIPDNVLQPPVGSMGSASAAVTTSPTGVDDMSFLNILNNINSGFQQNNALVNQKNVVLSAAMGNTIDDKTLAQLPPDVQSVIKGGNRDQMMLQAQILNDAISGKNASVASSIGFLTTGWENAQARRDTESTNLLNYSKAFGISPGKLVQSIAPELWNSLSPQQKADFINLPAPLMTTSQIAGVDNTSLQDVIASQESGGSYTAVNPNSGALGKYQIMPAHLSEIGLNSNNPQDVQTFLNNPQMQDTLYNQIMSDLNVKYGGNLDKILAAYYGGDAAAQVVGTPAGDVKQGAYPSINEYVQSIKDKLQSANSSGLNDWLNSLPAAQRNDLMKTANSAGKDKQTVLENVQGIVNGSLPPVLSGGGTSAIGKKISAGLTAVGYNLTKATEDWNAMTKRISAMNSVSQVRLGQAITFASDSLSLIDQLNQAWQGSGFPVFNKADLVAAQNGVDNKPIQPPVTLSVPNTDGTSSNVTINDKQTLATLMITQISDLTSEMGTVYKGGNTSTDESLKLAANNLQSDWSYSTLQSAVELARTNLKIRQNSMAQSAGIPGNQYSQPDTSGTSSSGGSSYKGFTLPN